MKRIVISIIVALLFVSSVSAKTTYIPIYRSYIQGTDGVGLELTNGPEKKESRETSERRHHLSGHFQGK